MHTLHYLNHHHPGSPHLLLKHLQTHTRIEKTIQTWSIPTVACHRSGCAQRIPDLRLQSGLNLKEERGKWSEVGGRTRETATDRLTVL